MRVNNKKTASPREEETVLWVTTSDVPIVCKVEEIVIVETENDGDKAYLKVNMYGQECMFPVSDIIDVDEDSLPQAA